MVFKNMCIKFHEVWINIGKVLYVETEGNYFRSVLTLTALQLKVECSAQSWLVRYLAPTLWFVGYLETMDQGLGLLTPTHLARG